MEIIYIRDLLLRTEVGFNPHEIGKKQDLIINISIYFDLQGEEISDNPDEALDYRAICKYVIEKIESKKFNLIESVANDVAQSLLENDRIKKVDVTIDKPHALRFSKSVAFRMVKER
ncbi:MAG: FolB domain-containing protein [Bacteroidales bacterium]|nr:FolB domain-containing protein [Bacteroidales bacterium]